MRSDFVHLLERADESVEATRKKYSASLTTKSGASSTNAPSILAQSIPSPDQSPISVIFEDLHLRYQAAIIELRVHVIPETSQRRDDIRPRLLLTQLSKRDPIDSKIKPPAFARSVPLWAVGALALMKDHVDTFSRLADGGLDTFTFDLDSAPDGASVSYTRQGQPMKKYAGVTPLKAKSLPLANWTFIFSKDGCADFVVQVDAVDDPTAHPYADLSCKIKRNAR